MEIDTFVWTGSVWQRKLDVGVTDKSITGVLNNRSEWIVTS
jgi:hypothetical protein